MRRPDRIDFILFILFICVFFIRDLFSTLETQKMKTKELIELLQSLEQESDVIIMVDDSFYTFVGVYELKGKQYEPRQFMVLAGSQVGINHDKFSHTQRSDIQ